MTRFLTLIFWATITCSTGQSFGQVDTIALKNFLQKQEPGEEKFMSFLKAGKINDCFKYFSEEVIQKYGFDSLEKEMKHLSVLLSKHSTPKVKYSLGQTFSGVGTFGHDSDGNYEKESFYQFIDKDSVVYYFSLYYSDKEPIRLIKYYKSENFEDAFLKNLKRFAPTPTIPAPISEN